MSYWTFNPVKGFPSQVASRALVDERHSRKAWLTAAGREEKVEAGAYQLGPSLEAGYEKKPSRRLSE